MATRAKVIYYAILRRVVGEDPPSDQAVRGDLVRCAVPWKKFQADATLFEERRGLLAAMEPHAEAMRKLNRDLDAVDREIAEELGASAQEILRDGTDYRWVSLTRAERDVLTEWQDKFLGEIYQDVRDFVGRAAASRSGQHETTETGASAPQDGRA